MTRNPVSGGAAMGRRYTLDLLQCQWGARRGSPGRYDRSTMERLQRVVGPIATNVYVLADARIARGHRHRHGDALLAWIADGSPHAAGRSS